MTNDRDGSKVERPPPSRRALRTVVALTFLCPAPAGLVFLVGSDRIAQLPPGLQWPLVVIAFLGATSMSVAIALPVLRRAWLVMVGHKTRRRPDFLPLLLSLWPAGFTTVGFALLSEFLYEQGVGASEPAEALSQSEALTYYVWHFLDAIPYLEIPRTVGWELGFTYVDHVNPVLLLLYKLVVITPVLALGFTLWRERSVAHGQQAADPGTGS